MMELVDFNELMLKDKEPFKKRAKRTRRHVRKPESSGTITENHTLAEEPQVKNGKSRTQFGSSEFLGTTTETITLTEEQQAMYKTDPSKLHLNEVQVRQAINSFYKGKQGEFRFRFSLSADADTLIFGQKHRFVTSLEVHPDDKLDPRILRHFAIRFFSNDLEIENSQVQFVSFEETRSVSCEFNAIPKVKGQCQIFVDCMQNTNNFHHASLELPIS